MELVTKSALAAVCAALICLLLKRSNPELSLIVSICAAVVILLPALKFSEGIMTLTESVKGIASVPEILTAPILKCLGISVVSKIGADLCRDASQSATAASVELAGTICALSVAMPLMMSMLNMIGGML